MSLFLARRPRPLPSPQDGIRKLVGDHLTARGSRPDDMQIGDNGEPRYLTRMLDEVLAYLNNLGRSVTIEELRVVDRCAAGHVDYAEKFALRASQLGLSQNPPGTTTPSALSLPG